MPSSDLYRRLREEIEAIPLVDTHEHIIPEAVRRKMEVDFFYWFAHYASSDLVSAGMPQAALLKVQESKELSWEEKWRLIAPYWEAARNTGYVQALLLAARELFGIEDINEGTYQELCQTLASTNRPGWYREVMKERANIQVAILDSQENRELTDRQLFALVRRFDDFITVRNRNELDALALQTDVSIHSLDDLLLALDLAYEQAVEEERIVGVKSGLAYRRILRYERVTYHEAEQVFNQIVPHMRPRHPEQGPSWLEAQPLQDYMMHQVIQRAIEYDLPIQIHTGLQEGNSNDITNSNPTHLINLFAEYPEARFDIFHAGYPYSEELAVLAKNYPSVHPDLCWVHIISPYVGRRVLAEWLETVPASKIFAFGGDYRFVEGAYAHSRMARDGVARVLTEKVEEGYFSEERALEYARWMLHDNAYCFFNLEERWGKDSPTVD